MLILTAGHWTFSSQRVGFCNTVSIWAVITTEQVPTGPASKYTMHCTLRVSSAVLRSLWVKLPIKLILFIMLGAKRMVEYANHLPHCIIVFHKLLLPPSTSFDVQAN